jgi:hypothetical protein
MDSRSPSLLGTSGFHATFSNPPDVSQATRNRLGDLCPQRTGRGQTPARPSGTRVSEGAFSAHASLSFSMRDAAVLTGRLSRGASRGAC